ncbi:hypothetical protein BURKHO8Y_230061 [Burkholderia sp. 8Y]|nr:hypothetical protein BURKHO8Y_230061 [Burkholderia sp. 8Y]
MSLHQLPKKMSHCGPRTHGFEIGSRRMAAEPVSLRVEETPP